MIPTSRLDENFPDQKTVSVNRLLQEGFQPVGFDRLGPEIERIRQIVTVSPAKNQFRWPCGMPNLYRPLKIAISHCLDALGCRIMARLNCGASQGVSACLANGSIYDTTRL